jgi:hypothetical protein
MAGLLEEDERKGGGRSSGFCHGSFVVLLRGYAVAAGLDVGAGGDMLVGLKE